MTRNEVIQNADVYKTAQEIGIPMRSKGKNVQIICPGHEKHTGKRDGNFGSCILTDHGYHCFAAGCSANVIQMVQEQSEINGRKMSQKEALLFVCEVNGFTLDEEATNDKPFPFSLEELSLLGYKRPDKREFNLAHFKPEEYNGKIYKTIQQEKEKVFLDTMDIYKVWQLQSLECLLILKEACDSMSEKTKKILKETVENPLSLSQKIPNQNQDILMLYEKLKIYQNKLESLKEKIKYFIAKEKKG